MRIFSTYFVLLLLGACGSKTPEAEAPDEATGAAEAPAEEGSSEGESDEEVDEPSESEGGDAEEEPASESPDSAQRLLTQEGTSFLYDFSKSDPGLQAKERCEKSSGDDPAKEANCMSKATKAVKPQGFKFERDKEGQWWFVRFEIKGTKPIEHNRVKAEFADDSGKKITIKTQGPDQARPARGAVPASFEIELPDEYTLIIEEPGKGKMVYEPKLGLFDET